VTPVEVDSHPSGSGLKARAAWPRPRAIDLFSGCGGLTCGLRKAGFDVLAAVDIDPLAIDCYRLNHPDVLLLQEDVSNLGAEELLTEVGLERGELELLAGCPPCQGFSALTTLNGSRNCSDPRNELILDFCRLVLGVMPKTVLMENVPGLASDPRLGGLLSVLEERGYKVRFEILDTADYGVPQRRKRLLLTAGLGRCVDFPRPARHHRVVRNTLGRLPRAGRSGDPAHDHGEERSPRIRQLIEMVPSNGGSRLDLGLALQLPCHRRTRGFYDVYGRMKWDEPSPTITSGFTNPSKGRFLHPKEHRAITIREGALLQTFPPRYHFPMHAGKEPIARLIGNAVPPEFARRQGRKIIGWLRSVPKTHRASWRR
jgi:DNA (cytosine-5)-methyltransferase 1